MQTDARATAQDSARALADISRAIALNPGFAAAYINRAIISYQRGNFNRAVIDATRAISLRPDLAEAWNNRALAWHRLGQYDKAKLDFDQTIRLNKNYGNALIVREMASVSPGTLLWDLYKIPPQ